VTKFGSSALSLNIASTGSSAAIGFHENHNSAPGARKVGVNTSRLRLLIVCASSTQHRLNPSSERIDCAVPDRPVAGVLSPRKTNRLPLGPLISCSVERNASSTP